MRKEYICENCRTHFENKEQCFRLMANKNIKAFYQGFISWFCGCVIGLILTITLFKLGWKDKESILIIGYGGLSSVMVLYVKTSNQYKSKEMEAVHILIDSKVDEKAIVAVQYQINSINSTINYIAKSQSETRAVIDKIYDRLLTLQNKTKGGN
jgi:hypothetical protein